MQMKSKRLPGIGQQISIITSENNNDYNHYPAYRRAQPLLLR